jgi:predicted dehydrogenase
MALNLTEEQKALGKANFEQIVGQQGLTRRNFMKGLLGAAAALPVSAPIYFGYSRLHGRPVRTGLIGAGDEGGVLVGEHNPDYLEFIAYSDIRPSNQERIFRGQDGTTRLGFEKKYGTQARRNVRLYEDYRKLLENKDVEAVVIALPLHLHAPVAIAAMRAGKHVLCEKLMAWNVEQCKQMIRAADEMDRLLAIGHQRHYSLLYAQAVEVLRAGELGEVKHVRALWHRHNARPMSTTRGKPVCDEHGHIVYQDSWRPEIPEVDREALEKKLHRFGYKSIEELVRWRLYDRTGGGLMAELGSHQIDACSIFLGDVRPLAVTGVGGKFFYHDDREIDDHVFVTLEFPGKNFANDKNDIVVVTYSSINTNSFEPYGECLMGTKGTMVVQSEQTVYLFPDHTATEGNHSTSLTVSSVPAGKPVIDSTATVRAAVDGRARAHGQAAMGPGPASRGYREEMEHFAYCVRMWEEAAGKKDRPMPRCHGRVALADAVTALTSNQAMRKKRRIKFNPAWFDAASAAVPDAERKLKS